MISGPGAPAATVVDPAAGAAPAASDPAVSVVRGNVASSGLAMPRAERTSFAALLRVLAPWPRAALAASALGGIRVSVESTDVVTWTDDAGAFELRGDFSGPVALAFERDDGIAARVSAMVPRGGTVTLSDVHLDGPPGPIAVHFEGVVVNKDCLARLLEVASRFDPQGPKYTVDLTTSSARSASGLPVPCIALRQGRDVEIDGSLGPDGTIENAEVTPGPREIALPDVPALTAADPSLPAPATELPAVPPTP